MVKVKICGITNFNDAVVASEAGAWALGFIFYKKSPRYIDPVRVRSIMQRLPPFIVPVGVFVNEAKANVLSCCKTAGIHTIQFHGEETPEFCAQFMGFSTIKAFRVRGELKSASIRKYKTSAHLFDTYSDHAYGGTGRTFPWGVLKKFDTKTPIIVSGGINVGNIKNVIKSIDPYAVDVSSGVEKSPGRKDHRLIRELFSLI